MAAHRYWRVTSLEAYGSGDIEISELHLFAGDTRVDAPATVSASVSPDVSGAVSNLQDDVLSTAARWTARSTRALAIQWDFGGSPIDVKGMCLAGANAERFPLFVTLQWSDDAVVWTTMYQYSGIAWPGPSAKSIASSAGVVEDPYASYVTSILNFEGLNGGTNFIDKMGRVWTGTGGPVTSTEWAGYGASSGKFQRAGELICQTDDAFNVGTGDFCIEMLVYLTSIPGDFHIFAKYGNTLSTSFGMVIYVSPGGPAAFLLSTTGSAWESPSLSFGTLSTSTRYHLAVSRSSGTVRTFTNGVLISSGTISGAVYNGSSPRVAVGSSSYPGAAGTQTLNGYVDEFRFTKGAARYTSSFTPPIAPHGETGFNPLFLNVVKGRLAAENPVALGFGPPIVYGNAEIESATVLTVQSGSVKDLATGVRGQGIGRIQGTVKITPDAPTHRKVRLVRDIDGLLVRELWSDPATGAYDFQYIDETQAFTVITYDHLHNYRAVVADNITPELMP